MTTPCRFLIIDDDPSNNFLCNITIKSSTGVTDIQTFIYPEEGLHYIRQTYQNRQSELPTILLLDINMPVLTGWDVLREIDGMPESVKQKLTIYILSSSINQNDKDRAMACHLVSDYIEKPLTADQLKRICPSASKSA